VADTLSRKVTLLTTMRTTLLGFYLVKDSVSIGLYFGPIVSDVAAGHQDDHVLQDGFLFKGNQLCVR
jgi:hypothetical protein